jgi:isoleucyl-tRNA synthetase
VLALNFKSAGPVLKGDLKVVKTLLDDMSLPKRVEFAKLAHDGQTEVHLETYGAIPAQIFKRESVPMTGTVFTTEGELTVSLDITISDELKERGILREMIRGLQMLRKESGFEITDRVELFVHPDGDLILNDILVKNIDYIKEEVLATSFSFLGTDLLQFSNLAVDDMAIKVRMIKA